MQDETELSNEELLKLLWTYPPAPNLPLIVDWSGITGVFVCTLCGFQGGSYFAEAETKSAAFDHTRREHELSADFTSVNPCRVPNCSRIESSRGLCHVHATKARNYLRSLRKNLADYEPPKAPKPLPEHGTAGRWRKGCRCVPCVEAIREERRTTYARNKERASEDRRERERQKEREAASRRVETLPACTCELCWLGPEPAVVAPKPVVEVVAIEAPSVLTWEERTAQRQAAAHARKERAS